MDFKKNNEVVCILDTNESLIKDKKYIIKNITSGGFISLSGVYDKNRNYKHFNPNHFKLLSCVRKHKLNRIL